MKKIEYYIWASNSQILRAQKADHIYIDGTFDYKPFAFSQLICIITNDLVIEYPKPLFYILVNNKEQVMYENFFLEIYHILTNNKKLPLHLKGITVDFEQAQINALNVVFPNISLTGCLFHLKQAMWRWCRSNRLTLKTNIHQSREIINKLSYLCWNPSKKNDTIISLENSFRDSEFNKLIDYYSEIYLKHIDGKMIDYSDIEQIHRSNSCLESFNNQLHSTGHYYCFCLKETAINDIWFRLDDSIVTKIDDLRAALIKNLVYLLIYEIY